MNTNSNFKGGTRNGGRSISIDPDYAEAHYQLGLLYLLAGDEDSALEHYKILKELDSEWANTLFDCIYKE